jgi:hypothetical protein
MLSRSTLFPIKRNSTSLYNWSDHILRSVFPISQLPAPLLISSSSPSNTNTTITGSNGFNKASNTMMTARHFKTLSWRKRSIALKNRVRQAASKYKKPGQLQAVSMPLSPQEMDNTMLVVLSQLGKNSQTKYDS